MTAALREANGRAGVVGPRRPFGTIWARCTSARGTRALLALHSHAVGHKGHARSRVGHSVHHDEALEAHSHPAVDAAAGPARRLSRGQPLLGDENRSDRLALVRHGRATIEGDIHPAAARKWRCSGERETTTRDERHDIMVPTRSDVTQISRGTSCLLRGTR